jgi:peptide/nickel transport system substrate-binding protein
MTVRSAYTRRQALATAGAGLGALYLSGCGGTSQKLPTTTSTTATHAVATGVPGPPAGGGVPGGSITVAWTSQPNSLDPALGYDLPSWDSLCCLTTAPLLTFVPTSSAPAPNAAAAAPQVSADGLTYTIALRPGVRFHHGRAVTAQDYLYSWERLLDPKLGSWASSYLSLVEGANAVIKGKAKSLAGVKVLDPMTLQIRLTQPDVTFVNILAQPYMAAVPREVVQQYGKQFAEHVVSTGPFMLTSFDTREQTASFARNPHYFWHGLPYLDAVDYHWGVDPDEQLLQLENGVIQSIGPGVSPSLDPQVHANQSLEKYVVTVPLCANRWIAYNCARAPFTDQRVRQALNWAVDRPQITKVAYGESTPWGLPFAIDLPEYHRVATPYTYDPQRAKQLLSEAGSPKVSFTLVIPDEDPWPSAAQIIQQQLQDVGVTMHIDQLSESAYDSITTKKNDEAFGNTWYMVQPTALDIITSNFVSDASFNDYNYSDPTVDRLTKQALAAPNLAASNTIVAQIEQKLAQDAPGLWLASLDFVDGRSPALHNFHYNAFYGTYYDRLYTA